MENERRRDDSMVEVVTMDTKRRSRVGLAASMLCCVVLALTGCFETRQLPAVVPTVGSSASTLIGAEGGSIRIDDLLVTIPAGAVAAGTEIEVFVEEPDTSAVFTAFSPVVRIEPAGMELARPIEVRIPFRGDGRAPGVFGERADGGAIVPLGASVEGDVAITQMTYLASTFVGTACEGDACACTPNGQLDLLIVVDNSNSMAEEQMLLLTEIPRLVHALASGDITSPPDGEQDVTAFESIRVGVITTDIGVGAPTGVPTCSGLGDEGVLVSAVPGGLAACADYLGQPIAEYSASAPDDDHAFATLVGCNALQSTDGCGMEQQLEAALIALSPNAATSYTSATWSVPSYSDGRVGQGDMANAGFLREDSVLAILWLTDEEDCSADDSSIFDLADPRYESVDLNLRCHTFPEALYPVQRFVDGIIGLRRRPEDVIVAAITGTPTEFVATPGAIDYDALLDHPAMQEMIDPVTPSRLAASCTAPDGRGIAFPPRRMVSALRGIDEAGGRVVLQSICEQSFVPITESLAHQLAERAAGGC